MNPSKYVLLFRFYPKKGKEGIKPFSPPFQKVNIFFSSFIFFLATYNFSLVKCHFRRVLGQQQHFHLWSRINMFAKVDKSWPQVIFFLMLVGVFLVWLIKEKKKLRIHSTLNSYNSLVHETHNN